MKILEQNGLSWRRGMTEGGNLAFFRYLRSFTLIELLITIAILAILVGVLLPALNSARDKAQAASCVNNLKTIGMGIMQYVMENDSWLPPPLFNYEDPQIPWAFGVLGPNTETYPTNPAKHWDVWMKRKGRYFGIETYRCPSMSGTYLMDGTSSWWNYNPHYGINEEMGNGCLESNRIDGAKNPSSKLYIAETWARNSDGSSIPEKGYYRWNPTILNNAYYGNVAARHGGTCNTLKLDGSVAAIRIPYPFKPFDAGPFCYGWSTTSSTLQWRGKAY